ncbi:Nuclear pore protein [Aphelenchoides avenae]|nr:Nuclear pore protein [Aphelenchus avenae]
MRKCVVHFQIWTRDSQGEKLVAEDLETALRLHEVLFGFIRSGRLDAANELLERIDQTGFSMFLVFREMLVNPELTPMDDLSDNYPLARSRLLFKALARELITVDNDNVTKSDQCTWAALSGALSPLLTHAACSEDRIWSFVSCAVDARLDDEIVKAQNIQDDSVVSMRRGEEEVPKNVASIFSELGNYEECPYFKLYGYLASDDWARAVHYLDDIVRSGELTITAHQMRFFAHFILLMKCAGQQLSDDVGERVLSKFIDILIELNLYSLVPFYLSQLQPDLAHRKTVDFLYGIENEAERKEALAGAAEAGFDASALCRDVYAKAKRMNPFTEDEDHVARSAVELIRAWKWLTYYEADNIFDALVEANALIRKLFLHNRIAEATELMTTSSVNLTVAAETVFQQQFGDAPRPVNIVEANKEYCSYVMYFEGVEKYNTWLQHVESPAPELPMKLTDEQWARLDLKRRAEYELSIKKARDSLQKYLRVTDALKKNAVELLENILRQSEVWLTSLPGDEKSEREDVRQRAQELSKIRSTYMFYVIKMLIGVYRRTNDHGKVLGVARLLVDFRYDLQKALSKDDLRAVIDLVSQSGATLLESA